MSGRSIECFRVCTKEHEDGMIRAWMAPPHTMDGAVCIAAIRSSICEMDDVVVEKFKDLCRLAAGVISIEAFGVAPTRIEEVIISKKGSGS